ncbi:MAG: pyridoxamine 5'-phosphate oxidase family protein [Pikeienuella sp.]
MRIATEEQLRAIYGQPMEVAAAKVIDHLDAHCRRWFELSPFVVISTSNGDRLDASPKGDAPGFCRVEDEKHLLIPDWPGNNRIDGLSNIVRHPQVGLISFIPNVKETLRVNGHATIHDDEDLRAQFETRGRLPITVLRIAVEEVFLHCSKCVLRSKLWSPESWPERSAIPSMSDMIRDHSQKEVPSATPEELDRRYADRLY